MRSLDVNGILNMGQRLAGSQIRRRRRCLDLIERTLNESGLSRPVVVGIDDISGERILLFAPLAVHIVSMTLRYSVFQDIQYPGLGIITSADVFGAAFRKSDLGPVFPRRS